MLCNTFDTHYQYMFTTTQILWRFCTLTHILQVRIRLMGIHSTIKQRRYLSDCTFSRLSGVNGLCFKLREKTWVLFFKSFAVASTFFVACCRFSRILFVSPCKTIEYLKPVHSIQPRTRSRSTLFEIFVTTYFYIWSLFHKVLISILQLLLLVHQFRYFISNNLGFEKNIANTLSKIFSTNPILVNGF